MLNIIILPLFPRDHLLNGVFRDRCKSGIEKPGMMKMYSHPFSAAAVAPSLPMMVPIGVHDDQTPRMKPILDLP